MKKAIAKILRALPILATLVLIIAVEQAAPFAHESHHAKVKIVFIIFIAGIVVDAIVWAVTRPLVPKQQTQSASPYGNRRRRTRRA